MSQHTKMDDFEMLRRLGEGSFGQVFQVRRKLDGQVYALKKIKTDNMKPKDRENALNEIRILASMVGDHIIGYHDSFYNEKTGDLCIVLEFAAKGDLAAKINEAKKKNEQNPQAQIWKALLHITKGLKSLHDNSILHRDLKSANIFITENGTYKLGDLNISKILKNSLARTQTGTPYYCSPQVWQDKPYGPKSDMWSLGCVLYEMAAHRPPFVAKDIQGLYSSITVGVYPRIPAIYSDELADVIELLLKQSPNSRPSADALLRSKIVRSKCAVEEDDSKMGKSSILLETIKFNHRGWKSLNEKLPKPRYKTQHGNVEQQNCIDEKVLANDQDASQRQAKILSERRDQSGAKNCNRSAKTGEEDKKNRSRASSSHRIRQKVISACAKKTANPSIVSTSELRDEQANIVFSIKVNSEKKVQKARNNNLGLPPLAPSKRSRRKSDNYEVYMMPPRFSEISQPSSRNNSTEKKSDLRILQAAGKQIVSDAEHKYRIHVMEASKSICRQ